MLCSMHVPCRIADGSLPDKALRLVTAGKLIALLKPDQNLKPIGVGAARRRITGKAMCAQLAPELSALSHRPGAAQFASQYRGGCEAQVWLIKSMLSLHPTWLSLQVDGVNAFNSMDRRIMLEEIMLRCPKLYNYAYMFYGRQDSEMIIELDKPWPVDVDLPDGAVLMNADRTYIAITSETGVTQGDALAMILFTICLQRVLDVVAAAFPTVDVRSQHDTVLTREAPIPIVTKTKMY